MVGQETLDLSKCLARGAPECVAVDDLNCQACEQSHDTTMGRELLGAGAPHRAFLGGGAKQGRAFCQKHGTLDFLWN